MAGYNNYSKSNNAVDAESAGRYPLSIARKQLSEKAGISQKEAENILKRIYNGEWHHSSKMYNAVNYYDVNAGMRVVNISRLFNLPMDDAFFAAIRAWALDEEYEYIEFMSDEDTSVSGEIQTKQERFNEFVTAVKNKTWV